MGPCGCNHSKICDWCVGWSTVTETNLGAQASSNEHQREDKQGPSIYLLGSCHSNNVGFMARSTFAALHHASLTLLVANFLCILVILLISWLSESMVPNNSLDAFGVQDLTLCSKRLQVVRTSSNQRLTSPVFLNDELFQRSIRLLRVFVVGDGLVVFFLPWKTTLVERLDHNFRWNNGFEGPNEHLHFCRPSSSFSLSSFLICVSLEVLVSSLVFCHMFLSMNFCTAEAVGGSSTSSSGV